MTAERVPPGRELKTFEAETLEHDKLSALGAEAAGWHVDVSAKTTAQPTRIGRFVILGSAGAGAMGEVYAAYDNQLDRKVAIKVVHPTVGPSTLVARERLLREAQTLARVSHPNVVQVYEAGIHEGQVFLVMEFIRGRTLYAWLDAEIQDRANQWRLILDTYVAAGRGLAAAHDAGLVHRDFKPTNVLVGDDGRVRVVDFGLARLEEATPPSGSVSTGAEKGEHLAVDDRGRLTLTGALVGTPAYMSPEQMDGREADRRSDQFSFCVALYEALYGARPFQGAGFHLLRKATAGGPPSEPPRGYRVPLRLWRALNRGLAHDPENRHPSMQSLLQALMEDPAPRRRRWTLIAVSSFTGMLLGGVMMLTTQRWASEAPCEGSEAKLTAIWNDEVKAAMKQEFLATNRSYAAGTYERVAKLIDAYGQKWMAAHVEACEATHRHGEQSEEVLDLRMICLTGRLQRFNGLLQVLTRKFDGEGVDEAIHAVLALPDLENCSDITALKQAYPLPANDVERRAIAEAQRLLDGIRTAIDMGQATRVLEQAREARRHADATGFPPVQASAHWLLAAVQELNEQYADAESGLWAAARLAAKSRDEQLAANVWIDLINVVGYRQQRIDDALDIVPFAEIAISRAGDDAWLQARLARSMGGLYKSSANFGAAQERYQRVLDILQRRYGKDSLEATVSRLALSASFGLASLSLAQADYARAKREYERIRELVEAHYGVDHLYMANVLGPLAETLTKNGEFAQADVLFQQAIALERKNRGARTPTMARLLAKLAKNLKSRHELERAYDLFAEAIDINVEVYGPEHPQTVLRMCEMTSLLIERQQYEQAERWLARIRSAHEASKGTTSELDEILTRATSHLRRGHHQRAAEDFQRALVIVRESMGLNNP